jgi:hypothetical protein
MCSNIIASDEDVQRIWTMYVQYFQSQEDGFSTLEPEEFMGNEEMRELWQETEDLGVEKWKNLNDAQLNLLLGYRDGRPALFSKHRSKSGVMTWDSNGENQFEGEDLIELHPLWHQKVGTAAMAEMIWTAEKQQSMPGVLLADKVGMGKSAQVMMIIAMMIEVYLAEGMEKDQGKSLRPPILRMFHVSHVT